GERRPAARGAPADGEPLRVGDAAVDEGLRRGDGVLDVDDAPLAAQPLAVGAAVAGRAAVVDVDDADAAAGEERALEVEGRGDVPGRAAVRSGERRGGTG